MRRLLIPLAVAMVAAAGCSSSSSVGSDATTADTGADGSDDGSDATTGDTAASATDPVASTTSSAVPPTTQPSATTSTVSVPPTSDATTTTAATTAGSTTTSAAPTPTTSTTLPPTPTSGVALVHIGEGSDYPWTPVGWWDGTAWAEHGVDEDFEPLPLPTPSFSSVSVSSVDLPGGPITGLAYGSTTDFVCVDDRVGPFIDIGVELPEPDLFYGYPAVAVSADWSVQPRPVNAVGLDAAVYQEIGEGLVTPAPSVVPSNGDVVQVLRVDLDGDGFEEVLFTFEFQLDDFGVGDAGDFSLVVARYPQADGTVLDDKLFEHVVPEEFDFPQPGRASIAAVADLNGDGIMEVAVRAAFWESSWVTIYEFVDGALEYAMSGGCGV